MGKITRPATGEESLQIEDCPCCGGEISVGDCGYSSFNPGWAECKGKCKRRWSFSCVSDKWEVGERWNKKAVAIRKKLSILSRTKFDASDPDAVKMREDFETQVIGADKPKSRQP